MNISLKLKIQLTNNIICYKVNVPNYSLLIFYNNCNIKIIIYIQLLYTFIIYK